MMIGLSPAAPPPSDPATATPSAPPAAEVNAPAVALLKLLNTGTEQKLHAHPGLGAGIVKMVMDYRASGKTFASIVEFRKLSKISQQDFEAALAPFQEQEALRQFEATRKPVPPAPGTAGAEPGAGRMATRGAPGATAPGAGAPPAGGKPETTAQPQASTGVPIAQDGTGPIGAVRVDFYSALPGFPDLDKLDPLVRKEFLEAVNREKCACGCQNETVAWCLVNDKSCPVVKSRAKKIYDDIVNKPSQ
jgi:hypothetical protein